MKTVYVLWAMFCAGWGCLAVGMWLKPVPYGVAEVCALLAGVPIMSAILAFSGNRDNLLPKPSFNLRPWKGLGIAVFVSFTLVSTGMWALFFATVGSKSVWGGALQFFLLGLGAFAGVWIAPILFKSRFET